MTEGDALDLIQRGAWAVLAVSGPAIVAAVGIGLVVALFQALTQVQEMTLTFVPKIVGVMGTVGLAAPFMGQRLEMLTVLVLGRIETGF